MQVMKHTVVRWTAAVALVGGSVMPVVYAAEEGQKVLPTLLIKGEVISVDTTDPAAALLKVKDRYGFETPIYLTQETKIGQGEQALAMADLTDGTSVEVEYNFDINTAKRHAVKVNVNKPAAAASAPAAPAGAPAASPAPAASAAPAVSSTPEQGMTPSPQTEAPAPPASSSEAAATKPAETAAPSVASGQQPAPSKTTTQ